MNISPVTVACLKQIGWDIVRVSDALNPKATDSEIIAYAIKTNRVIITYDLDFTTLITLSGNNKPSVITLRNENVNPDFIAQTIVTVVKQIEPEFPKGIIVSVDDQKIRYRELPIERN